LDSQGLRQINTAFRSNLSGIMIFSGITNRLEKNKIIEEFLGDYTEKEARQILKYIAEGSQYNFLYINMQQKGQLYKNFNKLIITQPES
jgi:F0F1-type ATP synthase delta subunit